MKHYTKTISVSLAEKLKKKGMPMKGWQGWATPFISITENSGYEWLNKEFGIEPSKVEKRYSIPTYAEVFDWFAEQGYYISIHSAETPLGVGFYPSFNHKNFRSVNTLSWHEAAEKAIEKALTLI